MLLFVGNAWATACCGTASDVPAVLAPCEHAGAALSMRGSDQLARWDGRGEVRATSDSAAQLSAGLAAAVRFGPWGSVSASLPVTATWRTAGELSTTGAGLGDVRAGLRLQSPDPWGPLLDPTLDLGVVAPTGRGPMDATDVLGSDLTGQGAWMGTAALGVSRSAGLWPWHLGLSGAYASGATASRAALEAGIARRLTEHWLLGLDATVAQGLVAPTRQTTIGLRTVFDPSRTLRGWAGLGADVPLPTVGRALPIEASVTAGFMVVR